MQSRAESKATWLRRMGCALAVAALPACFAESAVDSTAEGAHDEAGTVSSTAGESGSASTSTAESGTSTDIGESEASSTTSAIELVVIGPLRPQADLDDGAIYPAADGYEAQWYPSGENTEGLAYLGEFPPGRAYYGYLRFDVPALPPGASIHNVVLELEGHDGVVWEGEALRVWIERTIDPEAIAGASQYPGVAGGTLSDVSMRWPDDGVLEWNPFGRNESPDLSGLVQSLIDDYGELTEATRLQFWIADDTLDGTNVEVGWLDSLAGAATAPSLTITYEPAG